MSSNLDQLIKQKRQEANANGVADADFLDDAVVNTATSDDQDDAAQAPAHGSATAAKAKTGRKAKSAKPSKAKNAKPSKNAASVVRDVMSALDDDQDTDVIADEPALREPNAPAFSEAQLRPILRPNGEAYRPRILGAKTDVETYRALRAATVPFMTFGYPGCGKTAGIEAAFGADLITVEGHGDMEVGDLVGSYTQQPDGTYTWIDGPLVEAMKLGKVLFVDDATLIPAPVLARLYPAMDGRKTIRVTEHENEIVTAADGFMVCGAHNPGAPGAIFSEALASRFLVHIEVESDLRLAVTLGVDRRIVKAAENMREARINGSCLWSPEMRELLGFKRVADALGMKAAVDNLMSICPEDARQTLKENLGKYDAFKDSEPLKVGG